MPYIGEILDGAYQITEQIGKGGTGEIYKAYHLNLHKYVVVKKIMDDFVGSIEARAEVDILKQLHHTGLPQVYNFLKLGNEVYTVMEYIDGYDFKYYLDHGYSFSEQSLWIWLQQLADVLDYLHKHGILHMDIKPGNIMLTNEGNICLIDFNISLNDDTHSLVGMSYSYASPEQYKKWNGLNNHTQEANIVLDARSDIYSLGVSFYQMMTKIVPNPMQDGMPSLSLYSQYYSKQLIKIVTKMMELDRNKRYSSAEKLKHAITLTQRSKAEKATLGSVFGIMLSAVAILFILLGFVVYRNISGTTGKDLKRISQEEVLLKSYYDRGEFSNALSEGERFLVAEANTLNKVENSKKGTLVILADCSRELGQYEKAVYYYEELLRYEQNISYYQGLAISYAHLGRFQDAQVMLQKATELGGGENDLLEIQAEIEVAAGRKLDAITTYKRINQSVDSVHIQRRLGYLLLQTAYETDRYAEQQNYFLEAAGYYEKLNNNHYASYNDRINLASIYEGLNNELNLLSILQGLIVEYPNRYEAYFRMAVWKYKKQMEMAPSSRNYAEVLNLMGQAEDLYRNASVKDEQFESFAKVLEDIR